MVRIWNVPIPINFIRFILFPYSQAMKWTEAHDIFFLKEILQFQPWQHKEGSVERGEVWGNLACQLGRSSDPIFRVTQRSVRDRYLLLDRCFRKKVLFRHWTTSLKSHVRYAHADRGISCPRSFSSERLCMQRSGELEQRLLADELSDKNEVTTVKSMPEVLTSLVDKVETMSSKIFNMDKSIKRLQSNRDAPCSNEGPSKNV